MAKSHVVLLAYHYTILFAVSRSSIKFLPGFEGPLPFELETGYVGVGEFDDAQLFYYFVKSQTNPKEDPLMIWLTGGPVCSSASALFYEIGPLTFRVEEYNGSLPTLVSTSYSWTKAASIIFVDSPVGSGFSYARKPSSSRAGDTIQVHQVDQFLRKWLMDHPEFLSNPFYVGGDSYSGIIVPALVHHIHIGNENGVTPPINLQGYVLGNPATDENSDTNSRIPFAHGMGLISDELYKSVSGLNTLHILLPDCGSDSTRQHIIKFSGGRILGETLNPTLSLPWFGCYLYKFLLSSFWANDENVRRALHVRKASIGLWSRCNTDKVPYSKDIPSSFQYHAINSAKGFRSLIYSGDHDYVVPFLGTQAWIRALNYSIINDWRPWLIDNQIAGYTRTYANKMTFATIKGGAHTADYKPKESSVLFERWIRGELL
ncbi:PREDICTED: serine carboxypeptidase-like 18 [Tarenaya hassleriana]|uniref:serine carboxypeptidase-like 18 n=1 Tax=Tarenaya hassleriana TaxID=28532 RepID=UPI00053CA912|nr:PREDICTED: serine carboxypeptidase-like 18 [Tarenaya hassleriana]